MIYVLTAENIPRNQALFDDFLKFRHRVFIGKLRYAPPSPDGRERDRYDTPEAIYLMGVVAGRVISSLRLNPTERPYMLQEVWPELIAGRPPVSPSVWEGSRFAVSDDLPKEAKTRAKWELVTGFLEYGVVHKIERFVGVVHDHYWENVYGASGWGYEYLGPGKDIDGLPAHAGSVSVSLEALKRVRHTTGIATPVLVYP